MKKSSNGLSKMYCLRLKPEVLLMVESIAREESLSVAEVIRIAMREYSEQVYHRRMVDFKPEKQQDYAEVAAELRATKVALNDKTQQLRRTQLLLRQEASKRGR